MRESDAMYKTNQRDKHGVRKHVRQREESGCDDCNGREAMQKPERVGGQTHSMSSVSTQIADSLATASNTSTAMGSSSARMHFRLKPKSFVLQCACVQRYNTRSHQMHAQAAAGVRADNTVAWVSHTHNRSVKYP